MYNISSNHHIAIPVNANSNGDNSFYVDSINKYLEIENIKDFSKKDFKNVVYIKGKALCINKKEYAEINKKTKDFFIKSLDSSTAVNVDDLLYLKWCYDKLVLNNLLTEPEILIQGGVYWVEFGYNVGSELRKLRPAILWRSSSNKLMWTVIPLTTKCIKDKYYFHYDLECLETGTAKIDCMKNVSYRRIKEQYFCNKKGVLITKKDYKNIKTKIGQYYMFNPLD